MPKRKKPRRPQRSGLVVRPVLVVYERGDGAWSLDCSVPCSSTLHVLEDSGPLSLFLSCVSPQDPEYDRAMRVWATLGNRPAWWCYACGAWGTHRAP